MLFDSVRDTVNINSCNSELKLVLSIVIILIVIIITKHMEYLEIQKIQISENTKLKCVKQHENSVTLVLTLLIFTLLTAC